MSLTEIIIYSLLGFSALIIISMALLSLSIKSQRDFKNFQNSNVDHKSNIPHNLTKKSSFQNQLNSFNKKEQLNKNTRQNLININSQVVSGITYHNSKYLVYHNKQ